MQFVFADADDDDYDDDDICNNDNSSHTLMRVNPTVSRSSPCTLCVFCVSTIMTSSSSVISNMNCPKTKISEG